jgi:hypothetical protein
MTNPNKTKFTGACDDQGLFWKYETLFPLARIFSFDKAVIGVMSEGDTETTDVSMLDLPFQTCSFELVNGTINTELEVDNRGTRTMMSLECAVVHELEPRKYLMWYLSRNPIDATKLNVNFSAHLEDGDGNEMLGFLNDVFIKPLHTSKIGTQKLNEKVKIGYGNNRRVARFNTVVHVVPTKTIPKEITPLGNVQIDWSHRWEVRGHWRTIDRIGKDRDGNYCVSNFTWVSEYIKGPENKPVIKKQRTANRIDFNGKLAQKPQGEQYVVNS